MLVSSYQEKVIKLPNQIPSLLFELPIKKKIPSRAANVIHKIFVKNQNVLTALAKRNYKLIRSFEINLGNEMIDQSVLKNIIKRVRYAQLLYLTSTPQIMEKNSLFSRLGPYLYNKLKGISSPSILCQPDSHRQQAIKLLSKFKNLKSLNMDTTGMPEASSNLYSMAQLLALEYSLKSLRYIENMSIIENFQFRYTEFIQLMTRQFKAKQSLRKIDIYVFQTISRNKGALNIFLKQLPLIQTLEEFSMCIDGKELVNKNLKQLCWSLSELTSLKRVKLTIIQPQVTREYLRLNSIPHLELDLYFKISSLQIFKLNLLKKLKMPVSIKLEEIEDKRFNDERFVGYLFKNISKIPLLKSFTYSEDFNESLSFCSRNHFAKYFNLLASRGFSNLSKLNLTFNNSLLIEFVLEPLKNGFNELISLEGITINVFEYKYFEPAEKAILSFLAVLPSCVNLKEVFFSVEGQVNKQFSQAIIEALSKCKQIRTLGNFSLKVDFELLLYFLSKISKLEALESLHIWFSPLNHNLENDIKDKAHRLYSKAYDCFMKMRYLEVVQIKFPVSSIVNQELQELKSKLCTRRKLNVQIDSLPIEIENFF